MGSYDEIINEFKILKNTTYYFRILVPQPLLLNKISDLRNHQQALTRY